MKTGTETESEPESDTSKRLKNEKIAKEKRTLFIGTKGYFSIALEQVLFPSHRIHVQHQPKIE